MGTTLRYELVKTRKPHQCFDCLRKFEAGTMMFSWACVDSGQMNSGYNCGTCHELASLISDPDELTFGWVHESLSKGQTPEEYLVEMNEYNKQRVEFLKKAKEYQRNKLK